MVMNSWFAVPNIPRRLYGEISVRYRGASCVAMPTVTNNTSTNWPGAVLGMPEWWGATEEEASWKQMGHS